MSDLKQFGTDLKRGGVSAALLSAALIGTTPIFGKLAISAGLPGLGAVAYRTVGATILLLVVILLFNRQRLYIYPLGVLGCGLAGVVNGLGSLLFYSGLERLDAGLGQLLYATYPIFVALLLYLDGQHHSKLTLVRLAISIPAIYLLTRASPKEVDLIGAGMMLGAGMLYGLHIPINQRILYEVPAPTVTLYTLAAMSIVVTPVYLLAAPSLIFPEIALGPVIGLTVVTFLSRLTLFTGVERIGGMQTSLLGLAQLLVTMVLARLWLGESLSVNQWLGAVLLVIALSLVGLERPPRLQRGGQGWLHWLRPPIAPAQKSPRKEKPEPPFSAEGS